MAWLRFAAVCSTLSSALVVAGCSTSSPSAAGPSPAASPASGKSIVVLGHSGATGYNSDPTKDGATVDDLAGQAERIETVKPPDGNHLTVGGHQKYADLVWKPSSLAEGGLRWLKAARAPRDDLDAAPSTASVDGPMIVVGLTGSIRPIRPRQPDNDQPPPACSGRPSGPARR